MMLWIETTTRQLFNTPYQLLKWLLCKVKSGESITWPDAEAMFTDFIQSNSVSRVKIDLGDLTVQLGEGVQNCTAHIPDWWNHFLDLIYHDPVFPEFPDPLPSLLKMIHHLNLTWQYVESGVEIVSSGSSRRREKLKDEQQTICLEPCTVKKTMFDRICSNCPYWRHSHRDIGQCEWIIKWISNNKDVDWRPTFDFYPRVMRHRNEEWCKPRYASSIIGGCKLIEQICNSCTHWKKDCVNTGWCKTIALTLNYPPTQKIEYVGPLMCPSDFGCNLFEAKPTGPFTFSPNKDGSYSLQFYSCGRVMVSDCATCPARADCMFRIFARLGDLNRQEVTALTKWLNERWTEHG